MNINRLLSAILCLVAAAASAGCDPKGFCLATHPNPADCEDGGTKSPSMPSPLPPSGVFPSGCCNDDPQNRPDFLTVNRSLPMGGKCPDDLWCTGNLESTFQVSTTISVCVGNPPAPPAGWVIVKNLPASDPQAKTCYDPSGSMYPAWMLMKVGSTQFSQSSPLVACDPSFPIGSNTSSARVYSADCEDGSHAAYNATKYWTPGK
jgi:hypothetical protein